MSVVQEIPKWLQELRTKPTGRIALKLLRDWRKGGYRSVTADTVTLEGEEIQFLSLGKCWCVECELYRQDLLESYAIKGLAEIISSELEKRGEICVFLDDKSKMIRIKAKSTKRA